jgi:signal transduction histidine kinase
VPAADRERIFEKFQQGQHQARSGAGLGLTFCKLAVEAHGGQIWVEDNPGGSTGSAFIFNLPGNGTLAA